MYEANEETKARLENNFTYHAPHGDQADRYGILRGKAMGMACELVTFCPPSRELSVALTKLEEVMFWANAAIARNEKKAE